MAYKRKFKKPGKIKETYPYHLARQVVQSQGIVSKLDYERWWNHNRPRGLPKKPDIIYKREMGVFSWGDFLGIQNDFPDKKVTFRSYEDCKKFIYALGLKNSLEWYKFCKEKQKPDDIPNAPMHYYSKTGEWIDWKDFLGYDFAKRHEYLVTTKKPMLYIARIPNRPFNVVKINVLMGEKQDLLELQKREKLAFIKCFYLNRIDDDWMKLIQHCLKHYPQGDDDEFFTPNIAEALSELSDSFNPIT
jgi:hypothetical protein